MSTLIHLEQLRGKAVAEGCWHQEQHDRVCRLTWRALSDDDLRVLLDQYGSEAYPLRVQNLRVVCRERGLLHDGPMELPDRYADLTNDQLREALEHVHHPLILARLREVAGVRRIA